jgi:hypothetical protein
MKKQSRRLLKKLFASVAKEALKRLQRKGQVCFGVYAKVVSNIFGKATKVLPSSHICFMLQDKGFEEMTEELFQDGVNKWPVLMDH